VALSKRPRLGRPRVDAPAGFVSLSEAAKRRNVSYSVVYRAVHNSEVRSRKMASGAHVIDVRDLHLIERHEPPADRRRIAVQLVPNRERHAAWQTAADAQELSVTEWLYRLADRAAAR
jgi:DNA-binding MarR family transcriptional regulator